MIAHLTKLKQNEHGIHTRLASVCCIFIKRMLAFSCAQVQSHIDSGCRLLHCAVRTLTGLFND